MLDISNGQSRLITNEEKTSAPLWVGKGNEILWLKSGAKGVTQLVVGDADEVGKSYVAGVVEAAISDIKVKVVDDDHTVIAAVVKAKPDGSMYNPENTPKKISSGMLYDNLMVRHWDQYVTPNKNSIWHGVLQKAKPRITEPKGRYSLGNLTNVLKGSRLESPIPPFGGADDFDIGVHGIGFVAKDPDLNPALNTLSNFYFVAIEDLSGSPKYSKPVKYALDGLEGASNAPSLSADGNAVAFLQMKQNGYESDKNRVLVCPDLTKSRATIELMKNYQGTGLWGRSPGSVNWGSDGKVLFLTAEEEGRVKLFKLDLPTNLIDMTNLPQALTEKGSISTVQSLGDNSSHLFLSSSNLLDNSVYSILDPESSAEAKVVSSNSHNGASFGLSQDQVSDIWFDGAGENTKVHAWVIKPSNFSKDKTYPLAYLIHGGPQGSWEDSWSTRWNPAVFAEQGYVVITPNPTGSTGYGQAFTDAIAEQWGGLPYEDLVKGFEYIKSNLSYVDTSRAVALGASYGGYMVAWMAGQPLAKEFKAFVCHDGSFNLPGQLASDEQYFPNHDLGGRFDSNMAKWEKWNPVKHVDKWETPMLVIHNELDYRLPISEGLAIFNVLQMRGIKSRFLTFPDENHWVLSEENSLVWHTVVLNWINGFVGLPAYKEEAEAGIEVQN